MALVEVHAKALADGYHNLGQQRSPVGIKQPVQRTAKAVIAEVLHLLTRDAKHSAGKAMDGLLLAVDGLAFNDDRTQQDSQGPCVSDSTTHVRGNVPLERILQADALNKVVDEG
jgi:hypothetical protein